MSDEVSRKATPLRVLVVDDNIVNRRVLRGALAHEGHTVTTADDGSEAVSILERETFDVVLMDLQMPVLDGFEATRQIRAAERQGRPRTPIIAVTADAMAGVREECMTCGMDGFVIKPIDRATLFAAIEEHTGSHDVAGTPRPGGIDSPTPDLPQRAAILERFDGDEGLLEEVVDLMREELPRLLGEVRGAVLAADARRVERAAHTLKSCVGHLGLTRLVDLAKQLEDLGHQGRLEGATTLLAELETRADGVMDALPALRKSAA